MKRSNFKCGDTIRILVDLPLNKEAVITSKDRLGIIIGTLDNGQLLIHAQDIGGVFTCEEWQIKHESEATK